MPARALSSDSTTLCSTLQCDQMDPEIRIQIQNNIQVLYDPSIASAMHIATCRGQDGLFLALIVKQDNLDKFLTNPQLLSSEPKTTRSAAMLSLLEATEQRIAEVLVKTNRSRSKSSRSTTKKSSTGKGSTGSLASSSDPKIIPMPTSDYRKTTMVDNISINSVEKPKETRFMSLSWKKNIKAEQPLVRNILD